MKYEELIKNMSWNNTWEYIFKNYKPIFDYENPKWFYKWIADVSKSHDLCNNWNLFKNNWKIINDNLSSGRICYICGTICRGSTLSRHLKKHNISAQDWYDEYTGIPRESRICPVCGKQMEFHNTCYYGYRKFCQYHHWKYIPIDIGHKALMTDEEIKSHNDLVYNHSSKMGSNTIFYYGNWWSNKESLTEDQLNNIKLLYNYSENELNKYLEDRYTNHIFNSSNAGKIGGKLKYEIYGFEFLPSTWTDEQIINRGYSDRNDPEYLKALDWEYKNHQHAGAQSLKNRLHRKDGTCTSYPELLLGDILFKLNIHYEDQKYFDNYIVDYYLPEYNVVLECDGEYKFYDKLLNPSDLLSNLKPYYYNRAKYIETKFGVIIKSIKSQDIVHYYNHNKRELYKLIIKTDYPIIKYSNLTN